MWHLSKGNRIVRGMGRKDDESLGVGVCQKITQKIGPLSRTVKDKYRFISIGHRQTCVPG